jgi:hypothetical protein
VHKISQNAKEILYLYVVNVSTARVMVQLFLCFSIPGKWNPQQYLCENLKTYMFICLTNLRVRTPATNWINGSLGPTAVPDMVVEKKISDSH